VKKIVLSEEAGGGFGQAQNVSSQQCIKRRMHEEDPRQDNMLCLEGAKRVHVMTIDTGNTLVIVDPFNNQLTREDDKGTTDGEGRRRR
jgi:hypothetical protein